jgi:hypothetical protein
MGSNPIIGTLENAILREKFNQLRNLAWRELEFSSSPTRGDTFLV